ncbi:MAG: flavin reductase family protein [Clostridiaceae bacterium]|nr:flavin reductase family protein [Clostridiaceae bacterium]
MLITAGTKDNFNTMTASWGGLGVLWEENVSFCFVRPQRYTYEFLEKSDYYTLCFFDEWGREALEYCGTHSGREVDKVAGARLTPAEDNGVVYFIEARLVLICRKIYYQDIMPENFLDKEIEKFYSDKDYHRMYIGRVEKCLLK